MQLHTVFFWLGEDITDVDRRIFAEELEHLMGDRNILEGHFGTPAATDRPVIDSTYDFGMVLKFADRAAQDAYQVSPEHRRFLDRCGAMWRRVQAYDIEEM